MPRNVLLLVNRGKPEVCAALPEVRALIRRHGRLVGELDADGAPIEPSVSDQAELVVVLGGDGTLLGQARRCVGLGLPMLGVNFGKLGFLAEFDLASLRSQAAGLFDAQALLVQDRPVLRVTVHPHGPGEATAQAASVGHPHGPAADLARTLAFNDAVVTAGPPYRMIQLALRLDGHAGPRVLGDGLIVSTSAGSTAYNAAAGGPIVAPDVSAMAITPIAAQSLSFRPVVVSGETTLEIVLERVNETTNGGTTLVLDGQVPTRLHAGQRVLIRRHTAPVRFVRNPLGSFWSTLINKMRWAAPPVERIGDV